MFQPGFPTLSSSLQQIYDTTYSLSLSLSPSWVFAMFCQGAPLGPILRYGFPWAPSQNKRFNGHSLRDIKRGATTSLGAFFDVWLPLVALWCGASAKKIIKNRESDTNPWLFAEHRRPAPPRINSGAHLQRYNVLQPPGGSVHVFFA